MPKISFTEATEAGNLASIYTNQTLPVHELTYSSDGKRMVFGLDDDMLGVYGITIIDVTSTDNIYGFGPEGVSAMIIGGHTGSIRSVRFSPSGMQVASGGSDNTIKIWDAVNAEVPSLATYEDHTGDVYTLSYHPTRDDRLASGDRFGTIYIWDTSKPADENPILHLEGHTDEVKSIRYSPDGTYLASGSYDFGVRLWNTETGGPSITKFVGHQGGINSVSYRPDGKRLASCSSDGTVIIWDTSSTAIANYPPTTQHKIVTLDVHTEESDGECKQVEYSPDGKLLATHGRADTIKIWNIEQLQQPGGGALPYMAKLMWTLTDVEGGTQDLSFHPNGNAIAFDGGDDAYVWIFEPPASVPTLSPKLVPTPVPTLSPTLSLTSARTFRPTSSETPSASSPQQKFLKNPPSLTNDVANRGAIWKVSVGLGVPLLIIVVLMLIFNPRKGEKEQDTEIDESRINALSIS